MNCMISSKHHCDYCSDGHPGSTCKAARWIYRPRHTENMNIFNIFIDKKKYQHPFVKRFFFLNDKDIIGVYNGRCYSE